MANQHILQVSELTKKVRFMLESELNTVWLCGEISNFVAVSSGHWYLSLKDSKSQVKCAMFKGSNRRVRLPHGGLPTNGQQVLVRAKVSLYEPRGDFQLIIDLMEDAGEGALRQAYEQLKTKLNQQGVFDARYKKPLPQYVKTIGLITSPTGAAVKDMLTVLKRRCPSMNVIIYPALVQGELAKNDIANAIKIADSRKECDLFIVGRGGGSLEDLWCFNEETVVKAISACQTPIISAVGHEIDTTLSDFAADLRAATPSAAAELASQDNSQQLTQIAQLQRRLAKAVLNIRANHNIAAQHLLHRLSQVHPAQKLQAQQQKADDLELRLQHVIKREITRFRAAPSHLQHRIANIPLIKRVQSHQKQLNELSGKLQQAMSSALQQKSMAFAHQVEQLHLVSPLATIARGYAIVRDQQSTIITQVSDVNKDEVINIQVSDGVINAKVIRVS